MGTLRTLIARTAAILTLAVVATPLLAQPDSVRIQLFRPPPNQLKVADLWRIRLENTTSQTLEIYLFGQVDEAKDGKIVDATTTKFRLPPGVKIITGAEIQPIDANYFNDRYKNIFLRTGSAPTGDYTVCVYVRLAETNQQLASDCYDQQVQVLTPPILIAPVNESTVEEKFPLFSWLPPSPLQRGQQVRYTLRIVEILGRQTPFDAMQSNPAWFERDEIASSVLQYPISSRPFTKDRRYAWMVKAAEDRFPMGESEIWEFTYGASGIFAGGDDPFNPIDGDGSDGNPVTPKDGKLPRDFVVSSRGLQFSDIDLEVKQIITADKVGVVFTPDLVNAFVNGIPVGMIPELLRSCTGD